MDLAEGNSARSHFRWMERDKCFSKIFKTENVCIYTWKQKLISCGPCVNENRGCFAPRLDEVRVLLWAGTASFIPHISISFFKSGYRQHALDVLNRWPRPNKWCGLFSLSAAALLLGCVGQISAACEQTRRHTRPRAACRCTSRRRRRSATFPPALLFRSISL